MSQSDQYEEEKQQQSLKRDEFYTNWRLTDTGTRYEHLRSLLTLWEDGIVVLQEQIKKPITPRLYQQYAYKIVQLTCAIETLRAQIDLQGQYVDGTFKLRREIDSIKNDPDVWKGGRGTDLEAQ